jgi:hypothetical protein
VSDIFSKSSYGHILEVNIPLNTDLVTQLRHEIPAPLFPDSPTQAVDALVNKQCFWIVRIGYRVGVYGSWEGGAANAVSGNVDEDDCKYPYGYKKAVDEFQRCVRDGEVALIPCEEI